MPAINGYWRKGMSRADAPYLPLTPEVIDAHLRGEAHIGLYPLSDDDTCWWVAADFDKEAAMLDALAYMKAARSYGIPAALEVSQSGRGAHVCIFFAHAIAASVARGSEAFRVRGSMHLSSYDRLFPSQDVHTGRGVVNLIAAPMNGKRRQHGTTVFLDPATLEPYEDQWAYLSSIARLSTKDVIALARQLPDPQIGHNVRRLQLPTSSRIIPRPAAIVRAEFISRLTLTANDLGPAMISAVKHAASIRNPEFDVRQRARRSTWDTPRFLYSYDETANGDLVLPRGLHPLLTELVESADSTLHVDDKRILGQPHTFTCSTPLRTVQTREVRVDYADRDVLVNLHIRRKPHVVGMHLPAIHQSHLTSHSSIHRARTLSEAIFESLLLFPVVAVFMARWAADTGETSFGKRPQGVVAALEGLVLGLIAP